MAALLYLDPERLPVGTLTLGDSAYAMLAAQADFAQEHELELWGWANHGDAEVCAYVTCGDFAVEQVTPYVCAMGLDLTAGPGRPPMAGGRSCLKNLRTFFRAGAAAPFATGTMSHDLGLRDAWNQVTAASRDSAYLYLDTGWAVLGLLNACRAGAVRQRFSAHPMIAAAYVTLGDLARPCP